MFTRYSFFQGMSYSFSLSSTLSTSVIPTSLFLLLKHLSIFMSPSSSLLCLQCLSTCFLLSVLIAVSTSPLAFVMIVYLPSLSLLYLFSLCFFVSLSAFFILHILLWHNLLSQRFFSVSPFCCGAQRVCFSGLLSGFSWALEMNYWTVWPLDAQLLFGCGVFFNCFSAFGVLSI